MNKGAGVTSCFPSLPSPLGRVSFPVPYQRGFQREEALPPLGWFFASLPFGFSTGVKQLWVKTEGSFFASLPFGFSTGVKQEA
jgi:hypothetical protein